jgi:hypothetical protein
MMKRLRTVKKEGILENKEDFLNTEFREKDKSCKYLE